MNLSQLRDLVLDLRAWTSSGKTFDQRLNKSINLAYRKMSKDVPEVLVPSSESHFVFRDQTSAADGVYAAKVDEWVLRLYDIDAAPLGLSTKTTWRPQINGTWDGVMHIETTSPATGAQPQRHRCREFWSNGNEYYVSLDRPILESDPVKYTVRIYQPSIYLKSDYIRVVDASAWDSSYENDQITRLDVGLVNRHNLRDFRGSNNGRPTSVFQDRNEQLRGPAGAPKVSKVGATPWSSTTLPAGDFTFKYTYTWGYQAEELGIIRYTPGGYQEPVIESPPSPESAKYTIRDGEAPVIACAPIDNMMNFPSSATVRAYKSGMKIRIYAARHSTVETDGATPSTLAMWPADGKFYPIANIDSILNPTVGGAAFAWTGNLEGLNSGIPDLARPLCENHLYRGWSLYPHQDKDFRIDFRVLRPPDSLQSDSDHPIVEPDAMSALVEVVMYYLCQMDGADQASAQVHLANYANELKSVRAQHASPAGNVTPSTWDQAGFRNFKTARYEEV